MKYKFYHKKTSTSRRVRLIPSESKRFNLLTSSNQRFKNMYKIHLPVCKCQILTEQSLEALTQSWPCITLWNLPSKETLCSCFFFKSQQAIFTGHNVSQKR